MSSSHYSFNSTLPEIESKIDALLAKMTLDEKVGQTMYVYIHKGNRKEMIERIHNQDAYFMPGKRGQANKWRTL